MKDKDDSPTAREIAADNEIRAKLIAAEYAIDGADLESWLGDPADRFLKALEKAMPAAKPAIAGLEGAGVHRIEIAWLFAAAARIYAFQRQRGKRAMEPFPVLYGIPRVRFLAAPKRAEELAGKIEAIESSLSGGAEYAGRSGQDSSPFFDGEESAISIPHRGENVPGRLFRGPEREREPVAQPIGQTLPGMLRKWAQAVRAQSVSGVSLMTAVEAAIVSHVRQATAGVKAERPMYPQIGVLLEAALATAYPKGDSPFLRAFDAETLRKRLEWNTLPPAGAYNVKVLGIRFLKEKGYL